MNKVFAISFCIIFVAISYYLFYVSQSERYNYEFHGRIEKISFDKKMIPTLVISGKSYYLRPLRSFKKNIEVGDLAIKKGGERVLEIIKKSNGKVLKYNL